MKTKLLFTAVFTAFFLSMNAQQEKCATMQNWERLNARDAETAQRMAQLEQITQKWIENNSQQKSADVYTIPVVVHVLYHTDAENISDAQIQSQIDVLNADFRLQNTDSLDDNHPFWVNTVDSHLEFCLAKKDPEGNATTGITRTYTDSLSFAGIDNEKFSETGGKDNWDPTKYLNLWVCNLVQSDEGSTLGYAAFPSDLEPWPAYDGVVIRHQAFGTTGTAGSDGFDSNVLGRTATHEVGHWLNLRHIWGDEACGDDFVDDTPVHEGENYGCPTFPHRPNNTCGTDENGEMFMNYMDYVDDNCMNMFSLGQGLRMRAAIESERSGLLTSQGCTATAVNELNLNNVLLEIYPNPTQGQLNINITSPLGVNAEIIVSNSLGQTINHIESQYIKAKILTLDMNNLPNGIYFVQLKSDKETINKKLILNK